jgi:hypothetical protein
LKHLDYIELNEFVAFIKGFEKEENMEPLKVNLERNTEEVCK